MNRNNIWIHIGLAVVIIASAAVLGQIDRWKSALRSAITVDATREKRTKVSEIPKSNAVPEVLVRFRPGVSATAMRKLTAKYNDNISDEIESVKGLTVIDDLDNAEPETVAAQYRAMTDLVSSAEVNEVIKLDDPASSVSAKKLVLPQADDFPNDPEFVEQWALHNAGRDGGKSRADIDALKAWKESTGTPEVVVAVLDTGVDYNHTDLTANMWVRPANIAPYFDNQLGTVNDRHGYDANADVADPMDDNGHGTHCAGIIGAEGNNGEGIAGVNWNVQIMPLKFLGRGGFGTTADAVEAINYAIDRKQKGVNVRIISASWGSTSKSKALEDVIRAAGEQGILFVAAAGNASTDNDKRGHYPSNYDLPNVISVAATDRMDNLASFSNFGAKTVHIAAPGKQIVSTWIGGSYREASGTSMATPYVSGVAALIISKYPNITVEELREKLLNSVDKIESLKGKVENGGRINAAKALAN